MTTRTTTLLLLTLSLLLGLSLVEGREIKWTGQANTAWDAVQNWDCGCIPREEDDVIIDNAPKGVQIGGNPASCKSLQVGGGGSVAILIIQGQLTVGAGGGDVLKNGRIEVRSSDGLPFTSVGAFKSSGGSFIFVSGALGGGNFNLKRVNFTEAAAKTIVGDVSIETAIVTPGLNAGALFVKGSSTLTIQSMTVADSFNVFTDDSAKFIVSGDTSYSASAEETLRFLGHVQLGSFNVGSAIVNVDKTFTAKSISFNAGTPTINFIGAPELVRTVGAFSGVGVVNAQGGILNINSFAASGLTLSGATVNIGEGGKNTVSDLILKAGFLQGPGSKTVIKAKRSTITGGSLTQGIFLSTQAAVLSQNLNIDSSQLMVTGNLQIPAATQLSLSGADFSESLFTVNKSCVVSQGNPFKVVSQQPTNFISLNGRWSGDSVLSLYTSNKGPQGIFDLGDDGSLNVIASDFVAAELEIDNTIDLQSGSIEVAEIRGSSTMTIGGNLLAGDVNAKSITFVNGASSLSSVSTSSLFGVDGGAVSVSGSVTTDVLRVSGGSFSSANGTLPVSATSVSVEGTAGKTLADLNITAQSLKLACDGECVLVTRGSTINVGN